MSRCDACEAAPPSSRSCSVAPRPRWFAPMHFALVGSLRCIALSLVRSNALRSRWFAPMHFAREASLSCSSHGSASLVHFARKRLALHFAREAPRSAVRSDAFRSAVRSGSASPCSSLRCTSLCSSLGSASFLEFARQRFALGVRSAAPRSWSSLGSASLLEFAR